MAADEAAVVVGAPAVQRDAVLPDAHVESPIADHVGRHLVGEDDLHRWLEVADQTVHPVEERSVLGCDRVDVRLRVRIDPRIVIHRPKTVTPPSYRCRHGSIARDDQGAAGRVGVRGGGCGLREPDDIPASEAVRLYEALERAGRAIAAGKTLLAKRVAASEQWKRKGHGSAAEHLAQISGRSLGAAKSELETSDALTYLGATKDALLDGQVSEAQGQIIANAAKVNPEAERNLLEKAKRTNHQQLRDEAQKAKAAADRDPAATHRRIHGDRRLGRHTDAEGAWNLHARGTVADGSIISSELDRLTDEIFRAKRQGRHPRVPRRLRLRRPHRDGPALLRPPPRRRRRATGKRRLNAPQHLALLRLDVAALWRGYVEGDELCEVTGLGPIPVEVARKLLGDAVLKLIITKGVDIASVTSLTRGPTQAMHYAKLWTSPTCTVEGCTRTIVEYDHVHGAEYKDTRTHAARRARALLPHAPRPPHPPRLGAGRRHGEASHGRPRRPPPPGQRSSSGQPDHRAAGARAAPDAEQRDLFDSAVA